MRPSLAYTDSFEKAVRAEMAAGLSEAMAEAHNPLYSLDERIHKARRATKRLRGFLRFVRPALADYSALNAGLRDAARRLADPRDLTVRRQLLDELLAEPPPDSGLDRISETPARLAGKPRSKRRQERKLAAFSRDLAAIEADKSLWALKSKKWSKVAKGAARTYRSARKALKRAKKTGAAADFHDWRKRVKYHKRHLQLLAPLDDAPDKSRRKAMKHLSDLLGRHHDLEALWTYLRTHDRLGRRERDAMKTAIRARQQDLAEAALAAGKPCFGQKPGAFRSDIKKALP